MSMTKEEAIEYFRMKVSAREAIGNDIGTDYEAYKIALSALRPITGEQVEKVWRGCEKCNGAGEYSRYAENLTKILLAKYCPHCGRPLTDKAVDMVMERMEEVQNDQ